MTSNTKFTLVLIGIALVITSFFLSRLVPIEPKKDQSVAVQTRNATPVQQQAGPAVGSGTDTIKLIFNKGDATQILEALKNQFPTPQNAPNLTVNQFIATQNVFNYLAGTFYKRWPDLAPKQPTKPDTTKKK